MVYREREGQRVDFHAVHGNHEEYVELCRHQRGRPDREVPVLECPEREERDRPGQFERLRQRRDEVVTTLLARRRTPADARGRVAIRDDGVAGLDSGRVVDGVAPGPAYGYERDLGCQRVSGRNEGEQREQRHEDRRGKDLVTPSGPPSLAVTLALSSS